MYKEYIMALRGTRSRNKKIDILAQAGFDDVVLRDILKYTYNPFMHYYINRMPKTWVGKGTETLGSLFVEWSSSLERLAIRDISGANAKALVEEIITCLTPWDAELFKCILKKDLRAGTGVETINAAIPGLIPHFGVNLAELYERWTGPKWASLKIDGLRGRYKKGNFFTRNGYKIYGLDHLVKQIPSDITDLDGELDLPGIDFDAASGQIRSHSDTSACVYNVFGYPKPGLTFTERYKILKDLLNTCGPDIKLVKHVLVRDQKKVDSLFSQALSAGYEGLVLNEPDAGYVEKRSNNMLKLKNSETIDIRVIELLPGEPGKQYENCLGAFLCKLPNSREVKVGQGYRGSLSNTTRQQIWNDPDTWIGRMIEVKYHQRTAKGSLRHPRFVRPRDDKS